MDKFIRAVTYASHAAGVFGALLIAFAVLVICDMVIERYVFNLTTIWQIDAVTYSVIAATFISSPYVLLTRGHVNVDVLPLHVGPTTRYWLALGTSLVALAFCTAMFMLCTAYWYEAYSERWLSNTVWRARLWIPMLSLPVGLGLLVLQYVVEILRLVTGRALPFGIAPKDDAETIARSQAEQALGGAA
jgi:TRAP-type C4-dicarboxylate transport system permease small subunit